MIDNLIQCSQGGFNHTEIGEKITSKWKFPPASTNAIGFHHSPTLVDEEEWIPLVYTIYLANILCKLKEPSIKVKESIEPKVSEFF